MHSITTTTSLWRVLARQNCANLIAHFYSQNFLESFQSFAHIISKTSLGVLSDIFFRIPFVKRKLSATFLWQIGTLDIFYTCSQKSIEELLDKPIYWQFTLQFYQKRRIRRQKRVEPLFTFNDAGTKQKQIARQVWRPCATSSLKEHGKAGSICRLRYCIVSKVLHLLTHTEPIARASVSSTQISWEVVCSASIYNCMQLYGRLIQSMMIRRL